jgi:hypothetical protein
MAHLSKIYEEEALESGTISIIIGSFGYPGMTSGCAVIQAQLGL